MRQVICDAIAAHQLLAFSYEGFERFVEPHRCAHNTAGDDALLAWLVRGYSESGAGPGWRTYLLGEMRILRALEETLSPPNSISTSPSYSSPKRVPGAP